MLKQTFFVLVLVTTLGVVGVAGWLFFGYAIQEHLRRRPFDRITWQGEKSLSNDVRIRMVDDLLRRHNFRGMTRDQVSAVVGEPDKTEYFSDWDLVYWLGPERGFMGLDSEWLVFRFDSEGKVADVRVVTD